ncbi:RNA-binding domain-containing protein, partial [Acaromyces ingoldii]
SASDPRTQLFVSNLPYRVRWQDLKDLFRKAGTVLRADVSLTPDNRSRGHGTVLLATEDDAARACEMFRGFTWQGRTLEVRIDRILPNHTRVSSMPRLARLFHRHHSRPSSSSSSSPSSSSSSSPSSSSSSSSSSSILFVGNLPFHCQWQDLKDLFRAAGDIQRADVALGPDGRSRGFGTVLFATAEDAQNAVRIYHG